MCLQFDGSFWEDRNAPVPVVLHGHIINDKLAIEVNSNLVPYHFYTESVPVANGIVSNQKGSTPVLFVIVQSPGTYLCANLNTAGVPYLNLRRSAKVNAAVSFFSDAPVNYHLKITVVITYRTEVMATAVENYSAVLHAPVLMHLFVSFYLKFLAFARRHLFQFNRIGNKTLPSGKVFAVEH